MVDFSYKHFFLIRDFAFRYVTVSDILEIMSFKIAVLGVEAIYHTLDGFIVHILAVA